MLTVIFTYTLFYIHTLFWHSWFLRLAEHALLIDQEPDLDLDGDDVTAADVVGERGSARGGAKMVGKAVGGAKENSSGFLWTVDKFESAILAQVWYYVIYTMYSSSICTNNISLI